MLYHPYILELFMKQEEQIRTADTKRYSMIQAIIKEKAEKPDPFGVVILFIAEILIKTGTNLKRQRELQAETRENDYNHTCLDV